MKKVVISAVSISITILGMIVIFAPARSYSVREGIDPTTEHYSWEQWCYHESLVGFKSREKIGTFTLVGKNITSDSVLETDVCN